MIRTLVSVALIVVVLGGGFILGGLQSFTDDLDFGIDDDDD